MENSAVDKFKEAGAATTHIVEISDVKGKLEELIEKPAVGVKPGDESIPLEEIGVDVEPSPRKIRNAETGITPAGLGVAEYGSISLRSQGLTEPISLYPDKHIAILQESNVVMDMEMAFDRMKEEFIEGWDTQVLATGPSVTADMGSMVQGVHGPSDVDVIVLEDV